MAKTPIFICFIETFRIKDTSFFEEYTNFADESVLSKVNKIPHIVLYICLLGFFLASVEVAACTSHEVVKKEKSCCKATIEDDDSKDKPVMECCKEQKNEDSGCTGNCGEKSCQNSPLQTYFAHPIIKDDSNAFHLKGINSYPIYKQPYYSLGFHSIWQPPKIG